jgi:RNA polymerase primary sigma factor
LTKVQRFVRAIEDRTGVPPEVDEIAATLEMTVQNAARLLALLKESIFVDMSFDNRRHILERIPDTTSPGPEDAVHQESLQILIRKLLESLSEREAFIIRLRFGIDYHHEHTLEELGNLMGVSRERIRQIEAAALKKLQHPTRLKQLADSL